jgi:5-formyltetrahydrofolate cyclo-ligase
VVSIQSQRQALRKAILAERSRLSPSEQQQSSQLICKKVMQSTPFLRSHRIALYFANRAEVDTSALIRAALSRGKTCFLPILHPIKSNQMLFGEYHEGDVLTKNAYGILEPNLAEVKPTPAWSLDLVITPLVAFDKQGNRLGMGGGFYDRTFSFKIGRQKTKPTLLGLAYTFQQCDCLPAAPWDVPLDLVVTEEEIYPFHDSHPISPG